MTTNDDPNVPAPPPAATEADPFRGHTYPDKIVRRLIKPIEAHGKTYPALELRQPTTADVLEVGMPLDIDFDTGKITFREVEMGKMIARLAEIPLSSVGKLHPADFVFIMAELQVFFIPLPAEMVT